MSETEKERLQQAWFLVKSFMEDQMSAQPETLVREVTCGTQGSYGYWFCTRTPGHDGDHIATVGPYTVGLQILAQWHQVAGAVARADGGVDARPRATESSRCVFKLGDEARCGKDRDHEGPHVLCPLKE